MDAVAVDEVFKVLAHPQRRRLLELVRDEAAVNDLVEATGLTQPAVSQHLKRLREADLVTMRSDGTRRLYCVDTARLEMVRGYLDGFWNARLADLKNVAEHPPEATP